MNSFILIVETSNFIEVRSFENFRFLCDPLRSFLFNNDFMTLQFIGEGNHSLERKVPKTKTKSLFIRASMFESKG